MHTTRIKTQTNTSHYYFGKLDRAVCHIVTDMHVFTHTHTHTHTHTLTHTLTLIQHYRFTSLKSPFSALAIALCAT
jgi:hypothetical protein